MTDQQAMWNGNHAAGKLAFGAQPSAFGLSIQDQIASNDKILELGCGMGGDARLFASLGADVTATDFSDVAIDANKQQDQLPNLRFQLMDTSQPFPFQDGAFTAAYSHLALHYWNMATTAKVFTEISRVLKTGGKLFFVCKSEKDPNHGRGEEIEPGVFSRKDHIRHFFTPNYVRELIGQDFEITQLKESGATYAGDESAFVEVWAVKKS